MSIMGWRITPLAVAGILCVGVSGKGVAQSADPVDPVDVVRIEITGVAPSKHAVWVPGFWDLEGNPSTGARAGWEWVPGQWMTPPARNAHWFPAHWGWSDGWWSWIPGHWTQGENWIPSSI